jgi:hypothetical protein
MESVVFSAPPLLRQQRYRDHKYTFLLVSLEQISLGAQSAFRLGVSTEKEQWRDGANAPWSEVDLSLNADWSAEAVKRSRLAD